MRFSVIQLLALIYIVWLFSFLWGAVVINQRVWPNELLQPIIEQASGVAQGGIYGEKSAYDHFALGLQEYRQVHDLDGLVIRDKDFTDTGYLLISRYERSRGQSIVELMRLADGKILHTWAPDQDQLRKAAPRHSLQMYRLLHPLLLEDGSIITNPNHGPLIRFDQDGKILWSVDAPFHHSVERYDEKSVVVPSRDYSSDLEIIDELVSIVSIETGEILTVISLTDAILASDHRYLIYGFAANTKDWLHLNDLEPIREPAAGMRKGDIMWSCRNISTVGVLRPSTREIVWAKSGPWIAQHDINQLNGGRFSIFGNDASFHERVRLHEPAYEGKNSEFYIYDLEEGSIEKPFHDILKKIPVFTIVEGRSRLLPNGDLFIEEATGYRLLRVSKVAIRWEYGHQIAEGITSKLNWSRFYTHDELDLSWLAE